MAMEMLFKWMIKGCIWSLKIAFPPLNKFNSAVSTRLADAQHFSQRSRARLHEYGSVGTMVQFYDYLDVCNTLKPYVPGRLLFMGEMRSEKFLPFLQTSQGSGTPGWPTPPHCPRCLPVPQPWERAEPSGLTHPFQDNACAVRASVDGRDGPSALSGLESLLTFKDSYGWHIFFSCDLI